MRTSGILMPVFSLASKYGIGTFGDKAYEFVDFLCLAGQSYWQILPLNPTSYGDSPYQSFSSAAGNPYFIDLDLLNKDGLLENKDYENVDFGSDSLCVDYEKLYINRFPVLKIAFNRFLNSVPEQFYTFCKEQADWLDEYALFMAVKEHFGGLCWREWIDDFKFRKKTTLDKFKAEKKAEIAFYKFLQYEFYKQWSELKAYANSKGIKIIGDMPIYVADDSADVWSDTKQFDFDENLIPNVVAGCPPDAFSKDGQLWGNPVYNWKYMKNSEHPYEWWIKRMRNALKVYDVVRIDHFRGLESYYCIKYGNKTAKEGKWKKGPGMSLFKAFEKELGKNLPIIAEDLGFLTDDVIKLLKKSGFPGMKVLQFAFDSREESDYLPHNYNKNCVVYTGTHDNDTIIGWSKNTKTDDVETALNYMHLDNINNVNWDMIRLAMMSVADTAIFMMPDLLGLGDEGRINTPSTIGDNWKWRIKDGCVNSWLAEIIKDMTATYGRLSNYCKNNKNLGA